MFTVYLFFISYSWINWQTFAHAHIYSRWKEFFFLKINFSFIFEHTTSHAQQNLDFPKKLNLPKSFIPRFIFLFLIGNTTHTQQNPIFPKNWAYQIFLNTLNSFSFLMVVLIHKSSQACIQKFLRNRFQNKKVINIFLTPYINFAVTRDDTVELSAKKVPQARYRTFYFKKSDCHWK